MNRTNISLETHVSFDNGERSLIKFTLANGAQVLHRITNRVSGSTYILALFRDELVVWRQYTDCSVDHGSYFGRQDHNKAFICLYRRALTPTETT